MGRRRDFVNVPRIWFFQLANASSRFLSWWRLDSVFPTKRVVMFKRMMCAFAALACVSLSVVAAEVDLKGVQCIVAAKDASSSKSADYKGGKVYFCCGGCASKFAGNEKKFATKANFQLVATKQYVQKACPFSGGEIDPAVSTKIAGKTISFCCGGCKSKVESAKDDAEKMKLVFGEKTFAKAFKKADAKKSK